MKLLSGLRSRSRADIEQEAAQELDAVVRAGRTPPPEGWTLDTGESGAGEPPTAPDAADS